MIAQLDAKLMEINQRYETNFDFFSSPGFSAAGDIAFFDPGSRKILFFKLNGRVWWVFDFTKIGTWHISENEWSESLKTESVKANTGEVFLEFILTDTRRCPISMAVQNRQTAEMWDQRLIRMLA